MKKLALNKETVRSLDDVSLTGVRGGITTETRGGTCIPPATERGFTCPKFPVFE